MSAFAATASGIIKILESVYPVAIVCFKGTLMQI